MAHVINCSFLISIFSEQLRKDENKEASEIILAALELKSSIEPAWIGELNTN